MANRGSRRIGAVLGAGLLLWIGLGTPHRVHPQHRAAWLEVNGLRWRALSAGTGDTTLLFLHGYGESLLSWRWIIDRFTPQYRVLAVDLPGFGLSDKPVGSYDYATYQRWVAELLARETRGPVVVVGHSLGGELAAGLAIEHPDRVVAAILLAPAGLGISPLLADSLGHARPSALWAAPAISQILPSQDSAWLRDLPEAPPPSGGLSASDAARQILEQFDFAALTRSLGQLRQPVLLIWGREDPTIPYDIGLRFAAQLPCHHLVTFHTLHRAHQTLPDEVAAAMLKFLAQPRCGAARG